MGSLSNAPFQGMVWHATRFALHLTFCGVALSGPAPSAMAAENVEQALPPPVPLYSTHVSKTTIIGAGMVVINTQDSLDTVLKWYGANLKDQMADVAVGPGHHHFLTHSGAGVDILAEGTGADAETKITLFWKSSGPSKPPPPSAEASNAPTGGSDRKAGGEAPATQAQNNPPGATAPKVENPDVAPPEVELARIEPLSLSAIGSGLAEAELSKLKTADFQPVLVENPDVAPREVELTRLEPLGPSAIGAGLAEAELSKLKTADFQPVPIENPDVAPPEVELARVEPLSPSAVGPGLAAAKLPKLKTTDFEAVLVKQPKVAAAGEPDNSAEPSAQVAESQGLARFKAGQYAEALLIWQHAAATGSVNAALYVGMMFDAGLGVPQSYRNALSWYQLAAEKGSLAASFNVGVMYDAGFGVLQDTAAAAEWYSRAAKGSGRAAFNLALLYEKGDGVPEDHKRANQYFKQAERLGVTAARSHFRKFAPKSASADDADSAFNTFRVIENDAPKSGSADAAAAVDRIRRLADQNDPAAQYDLGYCLENGIGVEMDMREAYAMYRQAAAGTDDTRLKIVAEAGANQVKAHLTASRTKP